jgi:hypothetical protein
MRFGFKIVLYPSETPIYRCRRFLCSVLDKKSLKNSNLIKRPASLWVCEVHTTMRSSFLRYEQDGGETQGTSHQCRDCSFSMMRRLCHEAYSTLPFW